MTIFAALYTDEDMSALVATLLREVLMSRQFLNKQPLVKLIVSSLNLQRLWADVF